MAVLHGKGGNYTVPSLGFLTVGSPRDTDFTTRTYPVSVPDYAIEDLLALGFVLVEGEAPAPAPAPAPEPKKRPKSAILTTDSFGQ